MELNNTDILVKRYEITAQLNKAARAKVTFISAPIGYGKSTAVNMWADAPSIQKYRLHRINPSDILPPFDDTDRHILIFENFHSYNEAETQNIITYIKDSPAQFSFVILSRGELPYELKAYGPVRQLCLITAEMLAFDAGEVGELLALYDTTLSDKEIREMVLLTGGHILALNALICVLNANKGVWNKSLYERAQSDVFTVFDEEAIPKADKRLLAFLSRLSLFEKLPTGLLPVITGQADAEELIKNLMRVSSFIIALPNGGFEFRPLFRTYFLSKAQTVLSDSERAATLSNGGLWFKKNGDLPTALHYYFLAGDYETAVSLLSEVAEMHAGATGYDKLKVYFTELPSGLLEQNPILIAAMSMLHAIYNRFDESKIWYEKLADMKKNLPKTDPRQKICAEKLIYLDIALPWKPQKSVARLIMNIASQMASGSITLQNPSVTGNLPSFLSGGKDFSNWSKQAVKMRTIMKPAIMFSLGRAGLGIADTSVAETFYERGDVNGALIELTKGINEMENGAPAENWFVGYTLMARIMLATRQFDAIPGILKNIRVKIEQDKATYLLANLQSVCIRTALYQNDTETVSEWFASEAPNEFEAITLFELHRFFTKARIYIMLEQYNNALILLSKVERFVTVRSRPFNIIECKVLQALTIAHMDESKALDVLAETLALAKEYKFTRVFADECGRMLELLNKYSPRAALSKSEKKDEFFEAVLRDTKRMAILYPQYLRLPKTISEKLTTTETEVLGLLAQDMSNQEIGEFLRISVNTVKTHTKNIFAKLSVNSRAMAVKVARENRLL